MPFDPKHNPYIKISESYTGWLYEERDVKEFRGEWRKLLGADSLAVEIGPGNGWFFFQYLQKNSDVAAVAIEKKFKRSVKTVKKIFNAGLDRGRVIRGRGELLDEYFAPGEVDMYIINFPTPWAKKRHQKHILFSEKFVDSLRKTISRGGQILLTTDHSEYLTVACEYLKGKNFDVEESKEGFWPDMEPTTYERKVKAQGREIYSIRATL